MSGGEVQNKKKMAIIGVSALILVAMVVAVTVGVTVSRHKGKSGGEQTSTSTKAIQSICQPTDYKKTCEDNLSKVASNVTDPKELVKAGFQVAIGQLREVIKNSTTLKALAKDSRANQALQNCKELLEYAIDDLGDSFDKLGPFDFTKLDSYVEDLKVWLSAAMTYEQTCLDGFQNTTGDAGAKMRQFLKTSQELTSNGLAMVSEVSTLFKALNIKTGRRLLQDAATATDENRFQRAKIIPAWIDNRRLDLATATPLTLKPDVVVSKKGDGKYKTINEALKDIPKNNEVKVFVIYVKEGVYDEHVFFDKHMTNVMLIGDGPTKTVITGRKNYADGTQTYQTATVGKYNVLTYACYIVRILELCLVSLIMYIIMFCSCCWRLLHCQGRRIREHSRSHRTPSRGSACAVRLVHFLQLQHGRVPRHPLHPNPQAILPRLHHQWNNRLHLWGRSRRLPKLQDDRQEAIGEPGLHGDSPR